MKNGTDITQISKQKKMQIYNIFYIIFLCDELKTAIHENKGLTYICAFMAIYLCIYGHIFHL